MYILLTFVIIQLSNTIGEGGGLYMVYPSLYFVTNYDNSYVCM